MKSYSVCVNFEIQTDDEHSTELLAIGLIEPLYDVLDKLNIDSSEASVTVKEV